MDGESYSNKELNNEKEIKSDYYPENEEDKQEEEIDKVALMGWYVRDKSYERQLANAEDFLDEPFLLEVDEVLPLIEELKAREDFSDIYLCKGKERIYLFSEKYIIKKYANMMVSVEEKEIIKLMVETVREESKIYPRPTDTRVFSKAPYKLSKEEFLEAYELLKTKEEYSDIHETRASNKALYLYSDKFMKKVHATSLAEWIEVESEQNP
ncbi:MAG: hypothetical protein ACERLG_04825 [Sedimentibacter sp.]